MKIPSDTPVNVHATRSGALQALGLRPGQTFTAQVISHTPDGLTQFQIGNQQISLALPNQPQLGVLLQFQFQSGGSHPQIVLLGEAATQPQTGSSTIGQATPQSPGATTPQQNPGQASVTTQIPSPSIPPPAPSPSSVQSVPQSPSTTTLQQNPQLSGTTTPQQNPQSTSPPQTATPPPTTFPVASTPSLGTPNAQPLPIAQPEVSIPLSPALRTTLALQPGQNITATVNSTTPNGQTSFTIGQQQFSAVLPNNPSPNSSLQFQVQIAGAETRLVLTGTPATINSQSGLASPPQPGVTVPNTQATQALLQTQNLTLPTTTTNSVVPATSAQQALAQAAPVAVTQQDSVSTLISTLVGLSSQKISIPAPAASAGEQLLNGSLNLNERTLTGDAIQRAVSVSGIFMEARLASGIPASAPQGDMKAILMLMRSILSGWLGGDAELPSPKGNRQPPPMRGATPRSVPTQHQALPDGISSRDAGRALLSQTDAALSRLRLFQMSSMPESGLRAQPGSPQEWNLELPFMFGSEMNVAQFQISRDGQFDGQSEQEGWSLRFSMSFKSIGEVGAHISLRTGKIGAMIWAESEETTRILNDMLPELAEGLEARGLKASSLRVQQGAPTTNVRPSGGFVDAVS